MDHQKKKRRMHPKKRTKYLGRRRNKRSSGAVEQLLGVIYHEWVCIFTLLVTTAMDYPCRQHCKTRVANFI